MIGHRRKQKSRRKRNLSGKYPCDICGELHILEQHHIHGREILHANHEGNLTDLCPNCHTKVHAGQIILEGWVMSTGGAILIFHKPDEESFTGKDAKPYLIQHTNKVVLQRSQTSPKKNALD